MAKHEVVNEILDYLEYRKKDMEEQLSTYDDNDFDYPYIEGCLETYTHLIAKLEDDYR